MRASTLLLRSFLLGVASGGRSMTGLAAVALATPPRSVPGPAATLTTGRGRALVITGALGELVADKLPAAPSRLTPPSLALRMTAGAAAAALLATRERATPAWYVLPAAAGALAGSVAGARWRAIAADHGWPSLASALLEDAVVVTLAAATARR